MTKYLDIIIVAAVLAAVTFIHFQGVHEGVVKAVTNNALKTAKTVATVQEKKDEIRNRNPDADAIVKRLRAGTY